MHSNSFQSRSAWTGLLVTVLWLRTAMSATDTARRTANDVQAPAPAATYNYGYAVQINSTGDYKRAEESRTGDEVVGQYQILEPDGSLLIVTYTAGEGGYRPKITRMKNFAPPPAAMNKRQNERSSRRFNRMRERQMANKSIIDGLLVGRTNRRVRADRNPADGRVV